MQKHLSRHNNRILKEEIQQKHPELREILKCNCQPRFRPQCPLPDTCTVTNCIYICKVTETHHNINEFYTGSTVNFKSRYGIHKQSFNKRDYPNHTTLWDISQCPLGDHLEYIGHVWQEKPTGMMMLKGSRWEGGPGWQSSWHTNASRRRLWPKSPTHQTIPSS